jgi:hypothetical protein
VNAPLARLRRVGALAFAVLLLPLADLGARRAAAGDLPERRPPVVTMGLPLPGGGALWRHAGANPPPAVPGATWRYERASVRTFRGRSVDVMRFVARDADGKVVPVPSWDQADFVDPATGEVVGGLDGWGQEAFPDEPAEAPPCAGR